MASKKEVAALLRAQMEQDSESLAPKTLDVQRLRECADQLSHLDEHIATVETQLKELAAERRVLAEQTIPTLFDEVGNITRVTLDDGRTIYLDREVHPSVTLENQPKFFAWLKKCKFDGIIKNELKTAFAKGEDKKAQEIVVYLRKQGVTVEQKRFIHPMTFKAFVKERLAKGDALPSELDVNEVRVTKIQSKKG